MSEISRLKITSVRNLHAVDIAPAPTVNLLYGENGSGKTSLLEAINLLATGRSFRSSKVDPLINHEADSAVIYAELANGVQVGISKSRRQAHQLHFQGQAQRNWENVARQLPVQLLDSNSFLLLEGGPRSRRRFLDWGVFHVEPHFLENWRRSRKCLANRNHLLKQARLDRQQLVAWDAELSEAAEQIDRARARYLQSLLPQFSQVYRALGGANADALSLAYSRGWDDHQALADVLAASVAVDTRYGATQHGPHRAELDIRVGKNRALDILSRGQQKVLVSALKLAQGELLSVTLGQRCLYLVDDLPAELDRENRARVLRQLLDQGGQLFVTCVDESALHGSLPESAEKALFHVERGTITT
jgi:DNA replication and repair protein RecF